MTPWLLALSLCRALDASSSLVAFNRGAPELVPWMPRGPVLAVTVHVGVAGGQIVALKALSKPHPKLARVLAGVAAGAECGAGFNNVWQLTRQPK